MKSTIKDMADSTFLGYCKDIQAGICGYGNSLGNGKTSVEVIGDTLKTYCNKKRDALK